MTARHLSFYPGTCASPASSSRSARSLEQWVHLRRAQWRPRTTDGSSPVSRSTLGRYERREAPRGSRWTRAGYGATFEPHTPPKSREGAPLRPMPRVLEGVVDDPMLANPLERHKRLSTDWMGVIMEMEGALVVDASEEHAQSWLKLAHEEGQRPPFQWQLKRAVLMKAEQAISECFCWTRNPQELRRLAQRKEQIYQQAVQGRAPHEVPGARRLIQTLRANGVPVALVSVAPEARVRATLAALGVPRTGDEAPFAAVLSAEDVQRARPDPEMYLYACQEMGRPPLRTVVVSDNNMSVEAAHEVGMQCLCVSGTHPVYELTAADLVVSSLEGVSFINLKGLFRNETGRQPLELELQAEEEADPDAEAQPRTTTLDEAGW